MPTPMFGGTPDPISILAGVLGTPQGRQAATDIAGTMAMPAKRVAAMFGYMPEGYRYQTPQEADQWMRDQALGFVGSVTPKVPRPTTFWRGTNPGDTRRIRTGNDTWDSHLFAADNPESARLYGSHLTQFRAAPDAKILYEGTAEFRKVAGAWRKNESMLDYSARATEAAKAAGYDAVWFKRQSDVGTAIFNREKFPEVADELPPMFGKRPDDK